MSSHTDFKSIVDKLIREPFKQWHGFMHLKEYYQRTKKDIPKDLQDCQVAAERLFGWVPLNPSKPEIRDAVIDSYVMYDDGNKLPSLKVFQEMFNIMTNKECTVVFINGNRGVGKTAGLNNFFTMYAQQFKSKGYTFFRCDARKIEDVDTEIWSRYKQAADIKIKNESKIEIKDDDGESVDDDEFINGASLEEYINAHNIYVALMYARVDKVLEGFKVIMEEESYNPDEKYGKFGSYLKDTKADYELRLWRDIVDDFVAISRLNLNNNMIEMKGMIPFIAQIIFHFRSEEYKKYYIRFVNHFHKFLRGMQCFNGVILTIDGVDNFSRISTTGRNYYKSFLKQLKKFIPGDKSNKDYDKIIISLRSESYFELKQEVVAGYSKFPIVEFKVDPPSIKDIVSKRVKMASNVISDDKKISYFNFVKVEARSNGIFSDFLSEINMFLEQYVNAFLSRIEKSEFLSENDKKRINDNREKFLAEFLFNSNMRSMLRNLIGTYIHCRSNFDQYKRFNENINKNNFNKNFRGYLEKTGNKHEIILEGSILLGNYIVGDDGNDKSPARRGRWCPPIFSYPSKNDDQDIWFGLGIFRVLQFIHYRGASTEKACIKALSMLGYVDNLSRWFFNRSLMYGLTEVDEVRQNNDHVPFRLTKKGEFILKYLLDEDGLTYYIGASSLFPREFTLDVNYMILHGDGPENMRDFSRAALSVGLCIFRCIHEAHNREIKFLSKKLSELEDQNLNYLNQCFLLPSYSNIVEKWLRRFNKLYGVWMFRVSKNKQGEKEKYWKATILQKIASDMLAMNLRQ